MGVLHRSPLYQFKLRRIIVALMETLRVDYICFQTNLKNLLSIEKKRRLDAALSFLVYSFLRFFLPKKIFFYIMIFLASKTIF